MKKKIIIVLLILTFAIYVSNINVQIIAEENDYRPTSLELTPHDPISITSDSGFEVFLGTGTEVDPYIIEGYNITTTSDEGISITDTTKYFTVRNCYVDAFLYGIYIYDVADGTATVANNTCNNNAYFGIRLYASGNSSVANNTCNYNSYGGIRLDSSGSSTVANNMCNNNDDYGIYLWFSRNSTVTNNMCSNNNNWYGIRLENSGSSTVINNTCSNNNYDGIYLYYSGSSTVANNTCNNNNLDGIDLSSSDNSTVTNNTCNNNDSGISLSGSGSSTVANNTCENNGYGIYLYSSGSSTVANNTCSNNNNSGIYLSGSGSSTVANNTCSNNTYGISLSGSGSSTISNNACSNNSYRGISLYSSGSSTVTNNTCSNNNDSGIFLYSSGSSTVANNTCNNNYDYGIYLYGSGFCVVTYNLLQSNKGYGVYLESGSDNNIIQHNNFVDNNLGGTSQACDYGTNNTWYDSANLEGNYWSDWSGIGSYSIDGYTGSIDLYPLDEPTVYLGPPVITDIIHSPSTPTELDTISINATVTSPYGVQSVTLYYRVNSGTWQTISMTLISDNLYSVTIGSFAVSDTIEYYISAIDNSINHNEATNDNGGLYYSLTIGSSDVTGPSIASIVHSPSSPTDLDTVTINATVTDSSGVQSVTLNYRVNGGAWIEVSITLISGDIYSVTIGSFAVSDIIEYYVSAEDNSVNHNLAINDNSGLYYSFTISEVVPEFQMFSLLFTVITSLFLGFGLVVKQRRKRE